MSANYRFDIARLPIGAGERIAEQVRGLALESATLTDQATRVLAGSRFVTRWAQRYPEAFVRLLGDGFPSEITAPEQAALTRDTDLDGVLRNVRNRVMVCLSARQTLQRDAPEHTVSELSLLADTLVQVALDRHWAALVADRGEPRDVHGQPVRPLIFALGKLGGNELNFSSDIDLIAAHTASGTMGQRSVDDGMARLVRRLTTTLSQLTADGFVFRVDWRLRPFGSQGAPSVSLAALDSYFEVHAREWERYAWQKARCMAGDIAAGEAWLESIRPFIYRRYIDFGQIAGLRQMKDEIDRDVRSRGREQDIKRGWGGIREMEFSIQAQQLVHGGARPSLQQRSVMAAMQALVTEQIIDVEFAERWRAHYWFLRRVENAWQAVDDAQSHVLPVDEEPRQRLLVALGYGSWADFEEALQRVRSDVRAHFLDLFTPEDEDDLPLPARELLRALENDLPQCPPAFASLAEPLGQLARAAQRRISEAPARTRTLTMAVRLIDASPDDETAARVIAVLEAVCGRIHYVTLLEEHREARRELVELCRRSREIASELARQPALLIELCTPESLYNPPSRATLRAHIRRQLMASDQSDFEEQLDQLRRIRHAVALRIGAADVMHALPLMRVSDHLTELAEEIVRGALQIATAQMRQRYPQLGELPFAVVAYGKLGGMELSYSSDLDLVFVYRQEPIPGVDTDPQVFFTRLAQKLINALATQTQAGRCYEVDMRLRPNGNAGLLVTSVTAFIRYQREQAWTWEHQALVRSRAVAGSPAVMEDYARLRADVLAQPRDPDALRTDVCTMRDKMRRELARGDAQFHPKHMAGGMIDIEFFSQWLVLAQAHAVGALTRFSDVLRILEVAAANDVLSEASAQSLGDRYRALRARVHAHALGSDDDVGLPAAPPELEALFGAGEDAAEVSATEGRR